MMGAYSCIITVKEEKPKTIEYRATEKGRGVAVEARGEIPAQSQPPLSFKGWSDGFPVPPDTSPAGE